MNKRHGGFAMVTALVLLSLAAMTITVMGVTVMSQASRGRVQGEEGQLRAMLTAGARFARGQVKSNSTGHFSVILPDGLREDSAELTVDIRSDSGGNKMAEIEASLRRHRLAEELRFESKDGGWEAVSATLNP